MIPSRGIGCGSDRLRLRSAASDSGPVTKELSGNTSSARITPYPTPRGRETRRVSASGHEPRPGQEHRQHAQRKRETAARDHHAASSARAPRVIRQRPEEPAPTARPARSCAIRPRRWPSPPPTPSADEPIDHVGARHLPEQAHERRRYPVRRSLETAATRTAPGTPTQRRVEQIRRQVSNRVRCPLRRTGTTQPREF